MGDKQRVFLQLLYKGFLPGQHFMDHRHPPADGNILGAFFLAFPAGDAFCCPDIFCVVALSVSFFQLAVVAAGLFMFVVFDPVVVAGQVLRDIHMLRAGHVVAAAAAGDHRQRFILGPGFLDERQFLRGKQPDSGSGRVRYILLNLRRAAHTA